MSKNLPVVNWNNRASQAFRKAYDHILKESYNNAELVKTGIVEIIDTLPEHLERYLLDKFRKKNPGNYRAFEAYSYRVALPAFLERNQNITSSSCQTGTQRILAESLGYWYRFSLCDKVSRPRPGRSIPLRPFIKEHPAHLTLLLLPDTHTFHYSLWRINKKIRQTPCRHHDDPLDFIIQFSPNERQLYGFDAKDHDAFNNYEKVQLQDEEYSISGWSLC